MNFLDLIKKVSGANDEDDKQEKETMKSLPSILLSGSILNKSSIQRQCKRKTYLSSILAKNKQPLVNVTDEDIYEIFQNNARPLTDNQYLVEYLKNLHPFYDLMVEARGDKANEIIQNISFMLNYHMELMNNIFYRYGERDERCFIILEGKVDIISPNEDYIEMTEEQYVHYLIKLRTANELDLLKEVIDTNYELFPIDDRSFDNWIRTAYRTIHSIREKRQRNKESHEYTHSFQKKRTYIRRKSQTLPQSKVFDSKSVKNICMILENEIIKLYNLIESDYFINYESKYKNVSSEDYVSRIKPNLTKKRGYLIDFENNKFFIKTYFICQSISKGEIFGEVLGDGVHNGHTKIIEKRKRTSTAIASKNTRCAYLNKDAFFDLLRLSLEKLRRDKLMFLFDLRIFKRVNKTNFVKNFSNCIRKKIITDQTIIFEENGNLDRDHFVYFIRSGQYEASCFKSINDIDQVINEESIEINNEKFEKEYLKKWSFKLAIFGLNDIIGLSDSFHNGKYLFTLKCVSLKGILFELHYEFFQLLMKSDASVKNRTDELQSVKLEIRNKLLKQQKDVRLKFIYDKVPLAKKEEDVPELQKVLAATQNKTFQKKLKKANDPYDIDIALRDETSSVRAYAKTLKPVIHNRISTFQNSKSTSRNKNIGRIMSNDINCNHKGEKSAHEDIIKKVILRHTKQTIQFDVSNTFTNTVLQTKNTITADNDSCSRLSSNVYLTIDPKQQNKKEASQINPLAYDNFERGYNTEYYFKIFDEDNKKREKKYQLRITDSTKREVLKRMSLQNTIKFNRIFRTPIRATISNKKQSRSIRLFNPKSI